MRHQAIARKWRPQQFDEIVGQRHVTRTLQNAIRLGRIHHAFLLTGARGVGKTSAARILARALNCEHGPTPEPCNECASCKDMLAGTYPDVLEIDAASHNSVDDIRDLVDKARYAPQRGRYKVYVIDEVHMVTTQGFNALLKTLEEPPAHVVFILATTDPQKLLDTVISRCQRFDFKMIPVRTIYERLAFVAEQEGVQLPEASLKMIAREGGGSMRDAQSLLDQVLSFAGDSVSEAEVAEILGFIDRSILYDVLRCALQGDAAGALESLRKVNSFGYDTRTFAAQLLEAVRNVLVTKLVADASGLMDLPDQELSQLRELAAGATPEGLQQRFAILADAVHAIASSEQPLLLLEMAAVRMASVRPYVSVEALVGRLLQLERRLQSTAPAAPTPRQPEPRRSRLDEIRATPPPPRTVERASAPPPAPASRAVDLPASAPPAAATRPLAPAPAPSDAAPAPQRAKPARASAAAPLTGGLLDFLKQGRGPSDSPSASPRRESSAARRHQPAPPPLDAAPPPLDAAPPAVDEAPPPLDAAAPPLDAAPPAVDEAPPPLDAAPPPLDEAPLASDKALTGPDEAPAPAPLPEPAPSPEPAAATETPPERAPLAAQPAGHFAALAPDVADLQVRADPPGGERCDGPRWRAFAHELTSRGGLSPLKAVLAQAGYLGETGSRVWLGFTAESSLRKAQAELDRPDFQRALKRALGADIELDLRLDERDERGRNLVEELRRMQAEHQRRKEREAREHPAITLVVNHFPEARVVKVRVPQLEDIEHVG